MPRRLDPKKGLPGLFSPGRPKAAEMTFLVDAPPPPRRARKPVSPVVIAPAPTPVAIVPEPVPVTIVPEPVPAYIALAPAFRAVPVLAPEPERLRLAEVPALVRCVVGWVASLVRA